MIEYSEFMTKSQFEEEEATHNFLFGLGVGLALALMTWLLFTYCIAPRPTGDMNWDGQLTEMDVLLLEQKVYGENHGTVRVIEVTAPVPTDCQPAKE